MRTLLRRTKSKTWPKTPEKFLGRMPDGVTTTNIKLYVNAWRKASLPVGKMIGGKLFAFDPGFTYSVKVDEFRPRLEEFSTFAVLKINAALEAYVGATAVKLTKLKEGTHAGRRKRA